MKLLIATPTLDSTVHTGYLQTILGLNAYAPALEAGVLTLAGNSVITDARNRLFTAFVDSDADFMLFLDSDVHIPAPFIKAMIEADKPFLAAPHMKKNFQRLMVNMGNVIGKQGEFTEVDGISTAIMLIRRDLALKIAQKSKTYAPMNADTINGAQERIYDVFRVFNDNGKYWHEDYFFCHELRTKYQTPVLVKTDVVTHHYSGSVPFIYKGV